jgi:hypothetical protein
VSNDANGEEVTLGVAPSIAPARAQPPVPPLLTPHEPSRGETLLALTSLETGSVPPHVPHGVMLECSCSLPNNRKLHLSGLASPRAGNQSHPKDSAGVTSYSDKLEHELPSHPNWSNITYFMMKIRDVSPPLSILVFLSGMYSNVFLQELYIGSELDHCTIHRSPNIYVHSYLALGIIR